MDNDKATTSSHEPPAVATGGPEQPPNVLVADDSATIRVALVRAMPEQSQVTEASNGEDAWTLLQEKDEIELVITDLDMPRRSGMDLLQDVKSDPDMRSIPVVMVTGRHEDEYRHRARELGALAYLTKPFDAKALADTLAQLDTERSAVETRNGE